MSLKGADWMNTNRALEKLKENGYKYTDKREDMISFFENCNGYRTARDLGEFMKDKYDGISLDTIYRNLNLFYELEILEMTELDGEKHFRIKCDTDHHHHHFICLTCGKTTELEICPMNTISQDLKDYKIEGHKFEVYGQCPQCKSA